jgi:plastocyanin
VLVVSTLRRLTIATFLFTAAAAVSWVDASSRTVSQKGKSFLPGTITVKVGEALTFQNDDDVTHNAYSTSKGNEFNSKIQPPGNASTITFKEPGTVDVRCAFHPKMKLAIVVQK